MPKVAKEMSALEVKRLSATGKHAVGGVVGLCLNVNDNAARSWILRVTLKGKRKEIGLGSYPTVPLSTARERARLLLDDIRAGNDPVADRKQARQQAAKNAVTFSMAFEKFFAEKREAEFSNGKHAKQWRATLETYAYPVIGEMPVAKITLDHVLKILQPIWKSKTETASRLRARIENVLAWATVSGFRDGDNPARWRGNLDQVLPSPNKIKKEVHQPAVKVDEVGRWFALLQDRDGFASLALQFLCLNASRSQEIRKATWAEIDFDARMWTIPAEHMKMKRQHRVPLSSAAIELLSRVPRLVGSELIFPGAKGQSMSDMTLSAVMRRLNEAEKAAKRLPFLDAQSGRPVVPHGLRSTFRDWAAERTDYPSKMAELALAHDVGSAVEKAYRRSDMVEKRRQMMEDWAAFVASGVPTPHYKADG